MRCAEIYTKPMFGKRMREVDCAAAAAAGWPKVAPRTYYNASGGPATPPTVAPGAVTPNIHGTLPAQTMDIQIATGGAVLSAAGTVTVTFAIDGGADVVASVAVAKGDTGHQMAVKVGNAPQWAANNVTATVSGNTVSLDAGAGKEITKLTATVA